MTESDIERLGFDMVKSYSHDHFYTHRYQRGVIQVEFTYLSDNDKLVSSDVTLNEVVAKKMSFHEVLVLDLILN